MNFPYITAATAGFLLILQMILGMTVSAARGKVNIWVGDNGDEGLRRASRRHGNLAENAALMLIGLMLLELTGRYLLPLKIMAGVLIAARLLHAIGLSHENTNNPFRLAGGVATYLDGLALGALLLWFSANQLLP
jgi:uncharacterized membrane protein YecN with MAPEG domain